MTIHEMRADFVTRRKGSLALPITGIIVYSQVAGLTLVVDPRWHNAVLAICFWLIMPVGALIMKLRGEEQGDAKANPLFDLSNKARWMALSTWAVHIPVWIYAPDLFPLTVGILFALHWVVFSWTLGHPNRFLPSGDAHHVRPRRLASRTAEPRRGGRCRGRAGLRNLRTHPQPYRLAGAAGRLLHEDGGARGRTGLKEVAISHPSVL